MYVYMNIYLKVINAQIALNYIFVYLFIYGPDDNIDPLLLVLEV